MISQENSAPQAEPLASSAEMLFTPSLCSWSLNAVVGAPGMTVVYSLPLVSVPVAVVLGPLLLLAKVMSFTLWSLAWVMNSE